MKKIILSFLLSLIFFPAFNQVKKIEAVKTTAPIKIDGDLSEPIWNTLVAATDFITSQPTFGNLSKHKTEVKITYDNTAVYIGAYLYDNPENIKTQLTARDRIDRQDVDIFSVGFDTYQDRQNAFVFRVTAAGVQADGKLSNSGTVNDINWDAVWESKIKLKTYGWVAEIKIPFSAIRFSKNNLQNWGLNFARFCRKDNENSIWNPVNPNIDGDVNQWGDWTQIKNITPPLRLSFLPYLSGGVRVSPTNNGSTTEYLKSGGMDVKYGVNESFTLDMTLIPDFAQVQSDNVFLNLSPFQIQFEDFRPFFTEGTELFNKSGLFYSRRIGSAPTGVNEVLNTYSTNPNYRINKNPGITRLYNATKFSGRTKNNLGIGIFNAVTAPMYAKITNLTTNTDSSILTEPLTNYNIVVFDQAFKNRSYLTFTNTNVLRKGNSRNANVSSLDFSLFDKKNKYNFFISGKYSNIWGNEGKESGFKTTTSFGKISGLVQYNAGISMESDKYNPNDLGFLQNPNEVEYYGSVSYNVFKPSKRFLIYNYSVSINNAYLYKPFLWTGLEIGANAFFLMKNFWDIRFSFNTKPIWYNDYFVNNNSYTGHFLKRTPYYYFGFNGSSDSRKKFFFSYGLGGAESPLPRDPYWNGNLGLRYRFSDKFQLSANMEVEQDRGNWGWAFQNDSVITDRPIISRRDLKKNITILSGQYNFTPRMNLTIRMRHFWSLLSNTNFYDLKNDGYWNETTFLQNRNVNFNTFNIDMFYTWDFLLGSRITIGWKNALGGNVSLDPYLNRTYFKNFGNVLSNPHSNEITLKIVYFLDYLKLKRV